MQYNSFSFDLGWLDKNVTTPGETDSLMKHDLYKRSVSDQCYF